MIRLTQLLLAFVLLSLNVAHLHAQTPRASDDLTDIEVISVTASKRLQALNDVSASVSVIDRASIERIEAQHINQVLSRVAGTWISRGNGQEHLTAIRSPVLTGAGGCGAFFMALDGISLRGPGFCNANQLFDANSEQAGRIEVLKGPASTLYGTNAVHGAINIITQDAFDQNESTLGLQVGAYDFARLSTQLGWQNNTQALRLLSHIEQENGYQTNSGYDQQKATVIYQQRSDTWDVKSVLDVSNLHQETAGFIRGFESYKDEEFRRINPNPEAFRDAKSLRFYTRLTRDFNNSTVSFTPYVRWNEMTFLQHFLPWQALEENSHSSLGLQVQYDTQFAGAQWISGIDIDATFANLNETQAEDFSPNIPAGDHYDYDVDATALAAFTQAQWQWDAFALKLGGRLERTQYDYDNLLEGNSACAPSVAVCRFTRPPDQRISFSAFSPSATLEYRVSEHIFSYLKYSKGFRAPEATELFRLQNNQFTTDFEEVDIDAFELGMRVDYQTHSLHASIYDMHKNNVIIRDTQRQNIAGGETAHQGFELEYMWHISERLRASSNLTWQKHTYQNDIAISNESIKGNRVDTSPNQMYGARVNWQATDTLEAELAWQYLSDYYLDPENTAEYEGHSLLDLSINVAINKKVSAKISVFNLTDEDYAERADFAFGGYRYFVGQPRRAFVSVNWII
ncbi:TonB-dependent receptor [Glaciecola siphonariae]|uniref:TonB-dependent receptor n=1 Tax=Glaciecola siphonariae TaxID=521012 RepID=A0ABV9LY01_9ALTE